MARPLVKTSAAFNAEAAREMLWRGVAVPPEMLQRTLDKLSQKLDAKKTLFFTHQGEVQQKVEVEDHNTQMSAIDKILGISGAYVRERDSSGGAQQVTLTIDEATGVIQLVVGGEAPLAGGEPLALSESPTVEGESSTYSTPEAEREPEVEVVRIQGLPASVYKSLFEDK